VLQSQKIDVDPDFDHKFVVDERNGELILVSSCIYLGVTDTNVTFYDSSTLGPPKSSRKQKISGINPFDVDLLVDIYFLNETHMQI